MSARVDQQLATGLREALGTDFVWGRRSCSILNEDGVYAFGRLLLLHHAVGAPVTKELFEGVLAEAARLSGAAVQRAPTAITEGFDLRIGRRRLSLKSEASQRIRAEHLTISKLMESAWARDIKTRQDACRLVPRVLAKVALHDLMLVLRVFRCATAVRYELVEVPRRVLRALEGLRPRDFTAPTPRGHTTGTVTVATDRGFVLVFDGSDQKVGIRRLDRSLTRLHAWWELPRLDGGNWLIARHQ